MLNCNISKEENFFRPQNFTVSDNIEKFILFNHWKAYSFYDRFSKNSSFVFTVGC